MLLLFCVCDIPHVCLLHSEDGDESTSNPQLYAVTKNIAFITRAISGSGQANICAVALHLEQCNLITQPDKVSAVTLCGLPPIQVVAQLLIPVQTKIQYVPEKYDDFLVVLRSTGLEYVAEELETICECI